MIGAFPKRPMGSNPEALFMQWLWDREFSGRTNDVPGARVLRTTRGVAIIPNRVRPGAGGLSVSAFRFKVMGDDYMSCVAWDGTTEGAVTSIARPFKVRDSLLTEEIDGQTITYSDWDTDAQTRLATNDDDPPESETQVITPRYLPNDIILAVSAFTGLGDDDQDPPKKITLIDLNIDGRAYARIADDSEE